jgi:hypothetical protein
MQAMRDTTPEVAQLVHDRMMALSGAARFRMGVDMFDAARRMVLASLPVDLTDVERKQRLFERLYSEPLPNHAETCPSGRTEPSPAQSASARRPSE